MRTPARVPHLNTVLVTNKENEASSSIYELSQQSNEKNHASFMLAIYNGA